MMEARKYNIPRPDLEGGADIKYWSSINTPVLAENGEVEYIIRRVEDQTTAVHQEGERKTLEQERDLSLLPPSIFWQLSARMDISNASILLLNAFLDILKRNSTLNQW
ncbi:MAG TPA: hypothetical protein VIG33_04005 [Pseudobdellovibrionaceae bacterium]